MVTCSIEFQIQSFADLLVWPTGCFYNFWLLMLGVIFLVLAWSLYKSEEARKGEGEMLSSMGVSSLATTSIALAGTFIKNSDDVPMVQSDVLLYILAVTIVLVLIWMYKKE